MEGEGREKERKREREREREREGEAGVGRLPHKQSPHTKYTLSRERTQEMGGRNREKLHGRVWAMERRERGERESERTNAAGEGASEGDESTTSANVNVAWRL